VRNDLKICLKTDVLLIMEHIYVHVPITFHADFRRLSQRLNVEIWSRNFLDSRSQVTIALHVYYRFIFKACCRTIRGHVSRVYIIEFLLEQEKIRDLFIHSSVRIPSISWMID